MCSYVCVCHCVCPNWTRSTVRGGTLLRLHSACTGRLSRFLAAVKQQGVWVVYWRTDNKSQNHICGFVWKQEWFKIMFLKQTIQNSMVDLSQANKHTNATATVIMRRWKVRKMKETKKISCLVVEIALWSKMAVGQCSVSLLRFALHVLFSFALILNTHFTSWRKSLSSVVVEK